MKIIPRVLLGIKIPKQRNLDLAALKRRNRFPSFDNTAKSDNTRVVPVEKRTQYIRQKEKEQVVKKKARKQRAKQVATRIVKANNPNGVSPWDTKSAMFIANAEAHPEQFEKEYANWYSKVPYDLANTGAQLYDKDKVNLAKAQQAFYRDAAANIGVDWGNKLNPYTQRDLIANAAKSFGVTNATPYTLPLFASFTPGMAARTFMGSAIGGEVGGLIGSQVATAASDKPWAPLVGGLAGGFIGGGIGSYVPNRNYIKLVNTLNKSIKNKNDNLYFENVPKHSIAFPTINFPIKSWYDNVIDNFVRTQTPVMKAAEQKVFEYLGSEKHIKQIMKSGISRKEAVDIATQMRDNALATEGAISDVNPGTSSLLTNFEKGAYTHGFKYKPKSLLDYKWRFEPKYHINYIDDDNITYDTVIHELGGHGATIGYEPALAKNVKQYQQLYDEWFPLGRKVYEHNKSLKPKRKPEYESENITENDANYLKYLEDVDEYSARARSKLINENQKDHKVLYDFFTKESVDNLLKNVWSISPYIIGGTSLYKSNKNKNKTN